MPVLTNYIPKNDRRVENETDPPPDIFFTKESGRYTAATPITTAIARPIATYSASRSSL